MSEPEKMFYTLTEAQDHLHITSAMLARKLLILHIETRLLPGSYRHYITSRDVRLIERSIKEPDSLSR